MCIVGAAGMKKRGDERRHAHVKVRYAVAKDFVDQYTANLSQGGMFVVGGHTLEPLQDLTIDVHLPGYRSFAVQATVVHILDPAHALRLNRKPGAGVHVTKAPADYQEALSTYLQRLEWRSRCTVFAHRKDLRKAIGDAGYIVDELHDPEVVAALMTAPVSDVVGVVVMRREAAAYRSALCEHAERVITCDSMDELEDVLSRADEIMVRGIAPKQATGFAQRRARRERVHLRVGYSRAQDFVEDYAVNLSSGGLFVAGAADLELLSVVTVKISLPHRDFEVRARVAHLVDERAAAARGIAAGAGMEIVDAPDEFQQALTAYLMQLGRRRDAHILLEANRFAMALADAGYRVSRLDSPKHLRELLNSNDAFAAVVGPDQVSQYKTNLSLTRSSAVLVVAPPRRSVDEVLAELDELLAP